jgi:hypothetical protein
MHAAFHIPNPPQCEQGHLQFVPIIDPAEEMLEERGGDFGESF